jgi:hypothetical protein
MRTAGTSNRKAAPRARPPASPQRRHQPRPGNARPNTYRGPLAAREAAVRWVMAWGRMDDGFDDHPKVLALLEHEEGAAAIGLWTLCFTWAHRNTRKAGKVPGLVPAGLPRRYLGPGARGLAALLVDVGLWDEQGDEGWQFHDFDQYLPTEQTREARAEAGRRGAAKRWAGKKKRTEEPAGDSNLPSDNGNEPERCHDVDSNAVANDGSRAPAPWVIPNGITPSPEPGPVPPSADASKPRRKAAPEDPERTKHAGDVVGAFVDGARDAGQPEPATSIRARVGRDARQLLAQGYDVSDLIDSARRMGAGSWNDLAVQVRKDAAAAANGSASPTRGESTGAERARAAVESGRRLQKLADEGKLQL